MPLVPPGLDPVADRALGAFLGLAAGDALGTTLEFTVRDTGPRHAEMIGGGPFGLPAGAWTDDTAMAVALARSLLAYQGFEPGDAMERFVAWWREGAHSCTGTCFDIGHTTREALARYVRTGEPLAGDTAETSAGNGALMRLAPVAIATLGDGGEADRIARLSSRTTHGAPQSVDACALFAALLHEAMEGRDPLCPRTVAAHPQVGALAAGAWRGKKREAVSSSGYVLHTLEAALWSVGGAASFEEAVVTAVNLGDDADTVGAVTGQLAGAIYGASAIPQRWLEPLAWRDTLAALALDLYRASPRKRLAR